MAGDGRLRPAGDRRMIGWLSKLVTGGSDRDVRRLMPTVDRINAFEAAYEALSDEELRGKTAEFRRRLGTLPPEAAGEAGAGANGSAAEATNGATNGVAGREPQPGLPGGHPGGHPGG